MNLENKNVRKRKLRSPVWEYFESSSDRKTAKCKLCNTEELFITKDGNTTALIRHLKFAHGMDLKETKQMKVSEEKQASFVICKEEKIARLADEDGLSFRQIACSKTLRECFKGCGVTNYPLSPGTVSTIVRQYAQRQKNNLKEKLQVLLKNGLRFSLTMDEWTSAGRKRYMNLNLHALGGEIFNLGLIRIFGSFTADYAMEILKPKLDEFGINFETDIIGLVTDGASVMKKIGREFKCHQLCLAHGIHLAVTDVLYKKSSNTDSTPEDDSDDEDEEDSCIQTVIHRATLNDNLLSVVRKVRNIVKIFQRSSQKNEKLHGYTNTSHGKELSLILDCKTRWSSLFLMLERFDYLLDDVRKALIDLKADMEISADEVQTIKNIIDGLRPLESVTRKICSNDATLLTAEMSIQFMMGSLLNQKSAISNQLYGSVKSRIKERRGLVVDTLRYLHLTGSKKNKKVVESHFEPKPREQIACLIEKIYKSLDKGYRSQVQSQNVDSEDIVEELPVSPSIMFFEKDLNEFLDEALESPKVISSHHTSITEKVEAEMTALEKGEGRGNILEKVYVHLQSLPPSTVEAERAFSCANGFCSKIRSKMGDATIDSLVFLKNYFKRNTD